MILYKLTDSADQTHGGCQWGKGVTIETSGEGELCGPGFTHWYTHPLLAALLNPIHGNFDLGSAHLWEGEGEVVKDGHGLKVGCKRATTLRRVELPTVTPEQRVRFAILCAMHVCDDVQWLAWASRWLSGEDRSKAAARAAARAAEEAAPWAAARAAEEAARAAARAAAEAARAAARARPSLDLIALAEQAVREEQA